MTDRARPRFEIVAMLGSLTAFGALSIDMYLPALPAITADFGSPPGAVERTLASFLIGLAAGQLFYGPLSDRIGRRKPLLIGIVIYIAASIACGLVDSTPAMVALRFVQGIGACAALVISRAVVRDMFDHQESAKVFSMIMLVFGLAPILAPLAGSAVLLAWDWRMIFYLLGAFGAAMLFWISTRLAETRSDATEATARGEHPLQALGGLAGNPRLLGYMLVGACNSACLFTYISASPDLLMQQYGVSPTEFGWLFGINSVGLIIASQLNRLLLARFHADRILAVACVIAAIIGLILLGVAMTGAGGLLGIMMLLFGVMASFGFILGNANAGALSVDPLRAGSVSALLGASGFAVGAIAMTLASLFANGTPVPMAAVMCTSLLLAAIAYLGLAYRVRPA